MYRIAREAKSRVSIVRSVSGVTANEEERSLQHWLSPVLRLWFACANFKSSHRGLISRSCYVGADADADDPDESPRILIILLPARPSR